MGELIVSDLKVTLKKGAVELVKGLSFTLQGGSSLVLLGQSGCGKTMTCRAAMGLLDPRLFRTGGRILFDGTELLSLPERKRRDYYGKRIAFIPQNPMTALDPSVKIGSQMIESIRLHTDLRGAQCRERAMLSLAKAGLKDTDRIYRSRPDMLSGGMMQRVLIAMALGTDAELIIADEPTTALDVVHRNETVDLFVRLRQAGAAVLFVTHDFAAALRLGGNVLIMKDGAVIEHGQTSAVYDHPKSDYTKALVRASALSKGGNAARADC